ncbi:MAG: acyltransferase, partial [Treponema sp.]|nr:acyltransferase [Treponema sp.]
FRFGSWGVFTMELLIRKIEKYTGGNRERRKLPFSRRMELAREHILSTNEKRYGIRTDTDLSFEKRLDTVIDAALKTAERILNVRTEGEYFSRMYSLRQICWDRIVLPGVTSLDNMSGIERGTADLLAGEAWHAGRHVELIDLSWYLRTVPVPADDSPLHFKVEFVQNLWDFINRSIGGAYSNRISILPRRVIIQSAPPINLSERLASFRKDKKTAVQTTMADLESAYLDCINKVNQSE